MQFLRRSEVGRMFSEEWSWVSDFGRGGLGLNEGGRLGLLDLERVVGLGGPVGLGKGL